MSAGIGPNEIAEALLAAEVVFELGEWAASEDAAIELLVEARALDVDPWEHAAALHRHCSTTNTAATTTTFRRPPAVQPDDVAPTRMTARRYNRYGCDETRAPNAPHLAHGVAGRL